MWEDGEKLIEVGLCCFNGGLVMVFIDVGSDDLLCCFNVWVCFVGFWCLCLDVVVVSKKFNMVLVICWVEVFFCCLFGWFVIVKYYVGVFIVLVGF